MCLLLSGMLIPEMSANTPTHKIEPSQKDVDSEITEVDGRFVQTLYKRVERLLDQELSRRAHQLQEIHKMKENIKKELDQTKQERDKTEQELEATKEEEHQLRKILSKTTDKIARAKASERLQKVSTDKAVAKSRLTKLKDQENNLKALLSTPINWSSFKSEKELMKEGHRVARQLAKLSEKKSFWERTRSPKDFLALKELLTKHAEVADVTCSVNMISEKNSEETRGATIRYQTPEQRQFGASPQTAKCPTRCVDQMKPDRYYMWTERNNQATSDRNQIFSIARENEAVTLIESPN
jgi:exonuclease VII large subunit